MTCSTGILGPRNESEFVVGEGQWPSYWLVALRFDGVKRKSGNPEGVLVSEIVTAGQREWKR